MTPLYLILLGFTLMFPIALSFDRRVYYVRNWKWVFLSSIIIAIPFLIWDQYFTQEGIWGFNEKYLLGPKLGHLPIEEVMFFFVVPFACTFIYECVKYYFRNISLKWFNRIFGAVFITYIVIVMYAGLGSAYTDLVVFAGVLVLALAYRNIEKYQFIPLAFAFSFLPFLIINGVLTGFMLEEPIVWYNHAQFSNIRMGTIPLEDTIYGFSLIASNIILKEFVIEIVKTKTQKTAKHF